MAFSRKTIGKNVAVHQARDLDANWKRLLIDQMRSVEHI